MAGRVTGVVLGMAGLLATGAAHAQTQAPGPAPLEPGVEADGARDSSEVEEVVVTAQRREERLQTTPVTVSALSAAALEERNITRTEQVADYVPNLYLTDGVSNQSTLTVNLRGHGEAGGGVATTESPVAFYTDDVYQSRLSVGNSEFVDVERIEVLRGPQGTLYGRNSMSGALNVITRRPDDLLKINASASYGSFEEVKLRAGLSGPIAPGRLAGSIAIAYTDQGEGWKDNVATGGKVDRRAFSGVRGQLRLYGSERFELRLIGSYTDAENDGFVPTAISPTTLEPLTGDLYTVQLPAPSYGSTQQSAVSLHARANVGELTLRSITAYSEIEDAFRFDISGGIRRANGTYVPGFDRISSYVQDQFSQEFQMLGDGFGGRLEWIVGLYYFTESAEQGFNDTFYLRTINALVPLPPTRYAAQTDSSAAYGQATYAITPRLEGVLGLRFTSEEKTIRGTVGATAFSNETSFDNLSPKIGLNFTQNPQLFYYATISRGFKAGGFNGLGGSVLGISTPFDEETVTAYEAGLKSDTFRRRLRFNVAVFVNDYKDLQTAVLVPGTVNVVTQNALDVRDVGLELEVIAKPVEGLTLTGTLGLQDQDFQRIDPAATIARSGAKRTSNVANYSGALGFQYERPLALAGGPVLRFGSDFTFRDKSFASNDNNIYSENSPQTRLNAFVSLSSPDGRLTGTISGRNITDERDYVNGLDLTGFLGTAVRQALDPATYAVELRYRY